MKTTSVRANALACALLAGTALCGLSAPASAQTSPTYRNLDSNGVDLAKGDFLTSFAEASIGSGDSELALLRMLGATASSGAKGSSQWDHITFNLSPSGNLVQFNTRSDLFPAAESRGALLTGSGNQFFYRSPDGTRIEFTDPSPGNDPVYCDGVQTACILLPTAITSPDDKRVTINYEFYVRCTSPDGPDSTVCQNVARIASVTNSFGYEIRFAYAVGTGGTGPVSPLFHQRTGASFHNNVVSASELPSVAYSYPQTGVTEITAPGGRLWRVTSSPTYKAIRRPGAPSDTLAATLSGGIVTSVVNEGVTTNYSRSVSGNVVQMTVTQADPLGPDPVTKVYSDLTTGRPTLIVDPLDHSTGFTYDGSARLKRTTAHEGNYVEHDYDSRGNVLTTTAVPKGGSGPTIVTSASYDSTCANPKTCNQPNSTTDARGNVTYYEYDPDHGGVTRVVPPKPTPASPQPEIRYTYDRVYGEQQLIRISQCQSTSACVGTADEVRTELAYDQNGNLYWTATGDGTGALVAATTMTFDALGNMETVDGPLPGPADTSRFRYNMARQVTGTVSPDPDGGGPLKYRAVSNSYKATTGLLEKVEQGTLDSQPYPDWGTFAPAQAVETVYDDHARPIVSKLVSGSTVYSLAQTSYDGLGRPECSAQRMNLALFGSTLPSACGLGIQGTGTDDHGPDRISRTFYDLAGRATEVRTAVGTGDEASEGTTTYTANGRVQTVTDGENNKTSYEYDGHDRLSKTVYPMPAKGAGTSNASDFEQSTYESLSGGARTSGLVVSFRNRAGETIGLGHDALGRTTSKDLPGSEPDAAYGFDLLGRLLSATQNGVTVAFTYDALGRQLTQTIPIALISNPTFTSEWDLAGRRTRLTWPVDASGPTPYYADYDHLVTGEVSAIREKGATSGAGVLATYGYDDLGRRTSVTRGNGTTTSYQYGAVSRLASMTHDFAGAATTHDLTLSFTYNPASQIVSNLRTNDLYAWKGHGSGTTATPADGLNRLAGIDSVIPAYDPKGNLVSDGTYNYTYSSENLLKSFGPSGPLGYDPLMRFYENYGTYFIRDSAGSNMLLGEYYNGNVAGRYVPGPGVDEPLVTVTKTGARTWHHADERGSVIAWSDAGGAASHVLTYDEYGKGAPGNPGRFGYTGQAHLLGDIYDYKARNYNARLGRFLQTDPIGYGDGMNMYAYVGGDPVNFSDPSGMCAKGEVWQADPGSRTGRCVKDPSQGSGSSASNGSVTGGPLNGGSCAGCIPGSDPRSAKSIDYWGGYYENGIWVSTLSNWSSSFWGWLSTPAANPLAGSMNPLAVEYGQLVADYENGIISAEEFQDIDLAQGKATATMASLTLAPSVRVWAMNPTSKFFARGTGLFQRNNVFRIGQGWKGSATQGRAVFRISIGHRSWPSIRGLPSFPWHIP